MEMTNKEVSTTLDGGNVRPSQPEINANTENTNISEPTSPTNSQLLDLVRKQVEYYFSKENLASDSFLVQHMDASMSVPISVIMKFPKIKSLTQDEAVIRQALENSASSVSIVDNRLKANVKNSSRSTIILREIPSDTPVDEVREIFNYEGCKPISSLRSEIGDSWFVSFESEDYAKDTVLDLRMKKRTFRGQSVKARLKTETVVKSYFPVQTAPPIAPVFPLMGYPGMGMMGPPMPINLQAFGYMPSPYVTDGMPMVPIAPAGMIPSQLLPMDATQMQQLNILPQQGGVDMPTPASAVAAEEAKGPAAPKDSNSHRDRDSNANRKGGNKSSGGGGGGGNNNSGGGGGNRGQRKSNSGGSNNNSGSGSNNLGSGSGNSNHHGGKEKDKKDQSSETVPRPLIEINSANFPPLLSHADESTVPTPGYKDNFLKYSFDEVITIVKTVKEAILPPPFNPANHPVSMTTAPNLDLLKRQRTFSIDETREQLVQGRPVQREAVISGAVDVRSLLFGDEGVAPTVPAPSNSSSNSKITSGSGSHPVASYKAVSSGGASQAKGVNKTESPTVKSNIPTHSSATSNESSSVNVDAKVSANVPSSAPVSSPQSPTDIAAAKPTTEVVSGTEKEGAEDSTAGTQSAIVDSIKSMSSDDKPQKITPSTWAAMVMKSSAASTAESSTQTTAVLRPKQSSMSSDKKSKSGSSQGAVKPLAGANAPNGAAAGGSNVSSEKDIAEKRNNTSFTKDRDRDSRRRSERPRDKDRESGKPANGAAPALAPVTTSDRRDSKNLSGSRDENNFKENGTESSNVTAVESPTAPAAATGWGGKTSFANILKKAPEEAVTKAPAIKEESVSAATVPAVQPPVASSSTAHPPAASGAPSASAPTPSHSSSLTSSSSSKVSSSHQNNNHGHYNHAAPRKATAPVEANGVWVKETLPALKAADK